MILSSAAVQWWHSDAGAVVIDHIVCRREIDFRLSKGSFSIYLLVFFPAGIWHQATHNSHNRSISLQDKALDQEMLSSCPKPRPNLSLSASACLFRGNKSSFLIITFYISFAKVQYFMLIVFFKLWKFC